MSRSRAWFFVLRFFVPSILVAIVVGCGDGSSEGPSLPGGDGAAGGEPTPTATCADDNGGCDPNATCSQGADGISCLCNEGYEGNGATCSDVDECLDDNGGCDINATCTNSVGSFACACNEGYEGDGATCSDVDECLDDNGGCDTNATCTNSVGSFACACNEGHKGDGATCSDVDECLVDNGGCDANATCTNEPGSSSCACSQGYEGDGMTCADIDECLVNNGGCDADATCTNTVGSFTCACNPGFSGDGLTCADIDECLVNNGGCDADATCTNSVGSFACACNPGFTGSGITCTDVDECLVNNGGCDTNATCTNSPGSFTCACNSGYQGDGFTCGDADECLVNNGGCDADATCTNSVGSFSCACNTGFTGDGFTCSDIDECLVNNGGCDPNATCTNSPGSHSCTCDPGYQGDGVTCSDIDECLVNNGGCDANATCTNSAGSFSCACDTGFTGDGFTCSCVAPPPVADAGANVIIDVGVGYTIDGSGTTGGAPPLQYSWAASAGAPALSDPSAVQNTVTFDDCGPFSYQLTVTDFCGQQSVASVSVVVSDNGPHVSESTCDPMHQCGTVQAPWCTINGGVFNSATMPVKVAAGIYSGGVTLDDGVVVEGGYEPTFTQPRDPNPFTNGVVMNLGTSFLYWPFGVSATVDGIRGLLPAFTSTAGTRRLIRVSGLAQAHLFNVALESADENTKGDHTVAIELQADAAVTLGSGVEIHTPRAVSSSHGIQLDGTNASITMVDGAMVVGGGGTVSYGLYLDPTKLPVSLNMTNAHLAGGSYGGPSGGVAYGIYSDSVPLEVANTTVSGSVGTGGDHDAHGIYVTGTFQAGEAIDLHHNHLLEGRAGGGVALSESYAVHVDTPVEVLIDSNTEVIGCSSPCPGEGYGIYVASDVPNVTVQNNLWLEGGVAFDKAVGVYLFDNVVGGLGTTTAVVTNNGTIIGNASSVATGSYYARGLAVGGMHTDIGHNGWIAAGYTEESNLSFSSGLNLSGANGLQLDMFVHDNYITGGSGRDAKGLHEYNTTTEVRRNVIDGCGLPTSPTTPNLDCRHTTGVFVDESQGSLYVNNFIFGGSSQDSTALRINGCPTCTNTFIHNLMHAAGGPPVTTSQSVATAVWLDGVNTQPTPPVIRNCILDPGDLADRRVVIETGSIPYVDLGYSTMALIGGGQSPVRCYRAPTGGSTCEDSFAGAVGQLGATMMVDVIPVYANPQPFVPDAAGYHMAAGCNLAELGEPILTELLDYDGQMRGDGTSSFPDLGPDECN